MAGEVVEGSIYIVKLSQPERVGRHIYRYEVFYTTLPYGVKSPMIQRGSVVAKDRKDAEAWVKTLSKDSVKLKRVI